MFVNRVVHNLSLGAAAKIYNSFVISDQQLNRRLAGVIGDSEGQRVVDRIQANACREAMQEGATFINRMGMCLTEFDESWPKNLKQESKNILFESSGNKRRSCNQVGKIILEW